MMSNFFETLLSELAELLKMQKLQPDSNHSCLIKLPNGLKLQLEPDARDEFLLIALKFDHIPPGRYRENLFREALKANGMPLPRFGIFAYSKKSDSLTLFDRLHMKDLTGQKIFEHLTPFVEKASIWQEALSHGDVPANGVHSNHEGLFGMKP